MTQQKYHCGKRPTLFTIVIGTLTAMSLTSTLNAQPYFEIIDLGVVSTEDETVRANSINELDQITGGYTPPNTYFANAYLWENGELITLYRSDNASYSGISINESGWIVIGFDNTNGIFDTYLWKPEIGLIDLMIPFANISYAINDNGQISLTEETRGLWPHAYTWHEGILKQLYEATFDNSETWDINNCDQIVGSAGYYPHAALWPDVDSIIDIHPSGADASWALNINDANQIVGVYQQTYPEGRLSVFILENGHYSDLFTLNYSRFIGHLKLIALNNAGEVVGWDPDGSGAKKAFLVRDGVRYNLKDLIYDPSWISLSGAVDINDAGRIVGWGSRLINGSKRTRAFMMIPKDEFRSSGLVPGFAGEVNSIRAYCASPGGRVLFVYGYSKGEYLLPPWLCAGNVTLGIAGPQLAGHAIADVDGNVSFERMVSPVLEGQTIFIQALDMTTCKTSPVLAHHFPTK